VRLLIGLLVGLVLGAVVVLLKELTDRSVRSSSGAASASRYPVLVEIPPVRTVRGIDPAGVLPVAESPTSTSAEGYRMLRMSVMFEELASTQAASDPYGYEPNPWDTPTNGKYTRPEPDARKVILVVSPAAEETRPIVAANLGASYAESGQKAIVVSTDDIDTGYGLGRHAQNGPVRPQDVADALQSSSLPNVARLSLRHFVVNSGQLVTRAPEVFDAARSLADTIVVESPPFLESHHGEALLHAVDVVLVVVECRSTRSDQLKKTANLLRRLGAPVLGVVLTNVGGPRAAAARPEPAPTSEPEPEPTPTRSSVGDPQAVPEVAKS
jgi:polysaccharide biosynthesis transport protein